MGAKGRHWAPFISSVTWCESQESHSAEVAHGWRLFLLHHREILSLSVWQCWLGILSPTNSWCSDLALQGCAAPICYHGTAPAQGEMPALIGQKCQGKISLDRRSQFCCKIPRIAPSRTVACRSWAFPTCCCSFPSELPSPPEGCSPQHPELRAGPSLPPSAPPAEQQTGPNLASVNDFLCFRASQECCGRLWYPILSVLCISHYFSHYTIIALFLK